MDPGQKVYVTRVAYPTREQIESKCTPLFVEVVRPKAVLLRAGDFKQWFPRSVLKCSSNTRDVYLLAQWFKLSPTWKARCGSPPTRSRSK